MNGGEGEWRNATGETFHYYLWKGPSVRALLVLIHGFGEHAGRYQPVGARLAEEGICVAAPDLRGHGRSGGRRGDLTSLDQIVEDVRQITEAVFLPQAGQASYALFGHSFGGLAGIVYAMRGVPGLKRAIIQSPLIDVGFPLPRWKEAAAKLCARVAPGMALGMDLDLGALSHDPAVGQAYRADPLVHNWMTARAYQAILAGRDAVRAHPAELRVPTLFLYAGRDRIVSVPAAKQWFDSLTCDKRDVAFPEAYHELHHESVREDVFRLVRDWTLQG